MARINLLFTFAAFSALMAQSYGRAHPWLRGKSAVRGLPVMKPIPSLDHILDKRPNKSKTRSAPVPSPRAEPIMKPIPSVDHILDKWPDNKTGLEEWFMDRNYIVPASRRWDGGIVPYVIDSSVSECTDNINEAIAQIEANSCVDFVERTSEAEWIDVHRDSGDSGCYASVGTSSSQASGARAHHLGPNCCGVGTIIHEFLHNLGCYHEQSRPDRDDVVTVNWDKVETDSRNNFWKYVNEGELSGQTICTSSSTIAELEAGCVGPFEVDTFGYSYDLDSIMHYGPTFFSTDGSDTLTPVDSSVTISGQRDALSTLDKYKLNAAYGCTDIYPRTCGGLLEGSSGTMETTSETDCRWDIVAPIGSIILVEFHTIDGSTDCVTMEEPLKSTSEAFCSGTAPSVYVSTDNEVSVALTRSTASHFYATYRVITLSGTLCCQSVTFSHGGSTNFGDQSYSSLYLGDFTKDGQTVTDPTDNVVYPVYEHDVNSGRYLSHEDISGTLGTPWLMSSSIGGNSGSIFFGPSSITCPEETTSAEYYDFISANDFVDFPDASITCTTTCSNSGIPTAPSGYTITTDTSPTTFNFDEVVAYQKDDNTDCFVYSVCQSQDGTWSDVNTDPGCPTDSCSGTTCSPFI